MDTFEEVTGDGLTDIGIENGRAFVHQAVLRERDGYSAPELGDLIAVLGRALAAMKGTDPVPRFADSDGELVTYTLAEMAKEYAENGAPLAPTDPGVVQITRLS